MINILVRGLAPQAFLSHLPLQCIAGDKEEEFLLLGCSIIIGCVDIKLIPPDGRSAELHDGSNGWWVTELQTPRVKVNVTLTTSAGLFMFT